MLHVCVSLQDYSNALRVTVKGQATLKLITDKPTIRMDSQTRMVCYDDYGDDDDDDDYSDEGDFTRLSLLFL